MHICTTFALSLALPTPTFLYMGGRGKERIWQL